MRTEATWREVGLAALVVALLPIGTVAALHVWRDTPPSPPHAYVLERPLVAIVGGRAEDCLPDAWRDLPPERVTSLARRDTDWRGVMEQIRFALESAPPGILVAAIDPEQMLYQRDLPPDPDRLRRLRYVEGGPFARLYGVFDRWLSLPRLFEDRSRGRFDPTDWGRRMGGHWADPDALIVVPRMLEAVRARGIEVHTLLLPLPEAATRAWRQAERGSELDRILAVLGDSAALDPPADAYFPDGLTCSRTTGRSLVAP